MSKAVLLSIKPIWCEKIASGKKTVEIRKTEPKLDAPFKCFIYETQGITDAPWVDEDGHLIFKGRGAVIGEFVCDKISMNFVGYVDGISGYHELASGSCVSNSDLMEYGKLGTLYGWHISNLQIYDHPKPLGAFNLKRPPHSWCYVEE